MYLIDITVYSKVSKNDAINQARKHMQKFNASINDLVVIEESPSNLTGIQSQFKIICRINYTIIKQ